MGDYHIKLGMNTIYGYVHDASVVEPKKKAQGVASVVGLYY